MSEDKKFYVYSKPGCGYCDRLTHFLESHGLAYEKFTLGTDFHHHEFIDKFGSNSSFPQAIYEGEQLGGMKDTVMYLAKQKLL